jgi:hypothetical protein
MRSRRPAHLMKEHQTQSDAIRRRRISSRGSMNQLRVRRRSCKEA